MFKIGEFSKLTQVTIRMLRYYDEVGLLKPAEVDYLTGYRLYSINQISVLNKIIYLRDSGFQVAEIAAALNIQDDSLIIEKLNKKRKEIKQVIEGEKEKIRKIELAKKELESSKREIHYNITIKSIPSYQVLTLRRVIPNYYAEGDLWQELVAFTKQHQVELSSNTTFTLYHDQEYKETQVDVELCVPVKLVGKSTGDFVYRVTKPIPIMACTMVYGPFSNIAKAYLAFAQWLQENSQVNMMGLSRQIVHRGAWNESDPEKYLTELQIPLENKK